MRRAGAACRSGRARRGARPSDRGRCGAQATRIMRTAPRSSTVRARASDGAAPRGLPDAHKLRKRASRPHMSNVLYVVTHGEMSGVHRFLESVFLNHSKDVRPVILSFREGAWLDELRRRDLPVYCIDHARIREPVKNFRAVRSIIERERIDTVHSNYAWCHSMVAPAARWSGCHSIWFHHGPMSDSRWQGMLPLVPADLVLANSLVLMNRMRKSFYWAKRMGFVHYGIDAAAFAPDSSRRERFRREWALDESTIAIGIVGFIDTWKGQDIFLKAAKLLEARRGKIRMFVIGGPRDGLAESRCVAFERELRRYTAENHLEDFVHFPGHLDVNDGALDGLDIFA